MAIAERLTGQLPQHAEASDLQPEPEEELLYANIHTFIMMNASRQHSGSSYADTTIAGTIEPREWRRQLLPASRAATGNAAGSHVLQLPASTRETAGKREAAGTGSGGGPGPGAITIGTHITTSRNTTEAVPLGRGLEWGGTHKAAAPHLLQCPRQCYRDTVAAGGRRDAS